MLIKTFSDCVTNCSRFGRNFEVRRAQQLVEKVNLQNEKEWIDCIVMRVKCKSSTAKVSAQKSKSIPQNKHSPQIKKQKQKNRKQKQIKKWIWKIIASTAFTIVQSITTMYNLPSKFLNTLINNLIILINSLISLINNLIIGVVVLKNNCQIEIAISQFIYPETSSKLSPCNHRFSLISIVTTWFWELFIIPNETRA